MVLIVTLLCIAWTASAWGQQKSWEKEWNETIAAAKKEGRVVVAGSPDPVMRNEVIPRFSSRFGIPVELIAGRSSQTAARVRTERSAGIYSIDVFMSGPDTTVQVLYAEKMIDPLRPLLLLPEVVDPSKWKKGKPWFIDPEEKYILRVFSSMRNLLHINTDYVKPEEIRSAKDLLHPKWKGRISTEDPAAGGSGANEVFFVQLGEGFYKQLYVDHGTVRSRDRRQMADWLARGTYPICLNCREDDLRALRDEGFKFLEVFELSDVRGTIGASPWVLTVANRAPHSNAARVFANWMASKEGLEIYSRGYGNATLRSDVDESFLRPQTIPRPGVAYFDNHDWGWMVSEKEKVTQRIKEILKPR